MLGSAGHAPHIPRIVDLDLFDAARVGNLADVKNCLERGADVHAWGECASEGAVSNGHLAMVQFLVKEAGADKDEALQWAALSGHFPVVRYLAERMFKPEFWREKESDDIAVEAQSWIGKIRDYLAGFGPSGTDPAIAILRQEASCTIDYLEGVRSGGPTWRPHALRRGRLAAPVPL